jgi:hypothetical protein
MTAPRDPEPTGSSIRQRKHAGPESTAASVATLLATSTSASRRTVAETCRDVVAEGFEKLEKQAEHCRDVVAEGFEKLEKQAELCRDVVAEGFEKLEKQAEHCRDVVAEEIEKWSLWAYKDTMGEEWDAQPACFITDYLLAVQCFGFVAYITLYASDTTNDNPWFLIYFAALGTSAAFGGLLHHVAFEALSDIADAKKKSLVQTARVFGVNLNRKTVDRIIEIMWRIVLSSSILNNFALLALAASRHLSEAWAVPLIGGAGACYLALAIWASVNMSVLFLMVGFLPAMVFGAITSLMTLNWTELLVYMIKLSSGLVQGLIVSPSNHKFNHNALSHVLLGVAATFVLVHF